MTTKNSAAIAKEKPTKKTLVPVKSKPTGRLAVKTMPNAAAKKPKKEHKVKVVRDSFTMPQSEYQKIAEIKAICLKSGVHVKKSEVLRAGLKVLAEFNTTRLKVVLNNLEKIKTGRPRKH